MQQNKKKEARRLRELGYTLQYIATTLNISKSTASVWNKDIIVDQKTKRKNLNNINGNITKNKYRLLRITYQENGKIQAQKLDPHHIIGCMLYWGEGRKSQNQLRITNCDPDLLLIFKNFLLKYFKIKPEDIKIAINCYLNNNLTQSEVETYWLKLLELPITSLKKSTIKTKLDKKLKQTRKNRHIYGVCTLYVSSTEILHHIYGAIQEYTNIDKKWFV